MTSAQLATGTLAPVVTAIRLSLHVLAATVWVGGQFTVLGLLPTVRGFGAEAPTLVARALARILWPAYAILVLTGIWNILAIGGPENSTWWIVLWVKIGVVLLAGASTLLHSKTKNRRAMAVWGAVAGLSSVVALVLGVFLAG